MNKTKMIWISVPVKERNKIFKAIEAGLPRIITTSSYCSSAFTSFIYNGVNYRLEECFEKVIRFEKEVMKVLRRNKTKFVWYLDTAMGSVVRVHPKDTIAYPYMRITKKQAERYKKCGYISEIFRLK